MAVGRRPSSRVTAASRPALSGNPTTCMAAPRHNARASRSTRTRRGSSSLRAWPTKAFEPHGVDSVGFHPQPVTVRLPLDQPFGGAFAAGNQALQGIRRVGGRALTQIQSTSVAFGTARPWFEREGDQQPAQPRARHVGEDAPSSVRTSNGPSIPICTQLILPRRLAYLHAS